MLRFGSHPEEAASKTRQRNRSARRQRWRLSLLLVALGLVLVTMRQLNQPNTARRLGQIFGDPGDASQQQQLAPQFVLGSGEEIEPPVVATEKATVSEDASNALADVQDNTYFRPSETEAWFGQFDRLQQLDVQQLSKQSLGELTYAQLLEQPQVYRGKVVTIRGTLRREEVEQPAENTLGIDAYHRLMIQPRGGGHWPFVVYCLQLPESLPRGDNLQAPIAVTGVFFKNWSYAWQDGLGIAPVILARSVDWQPPLAQPARRTVSNQSLATTLAFACTFAMLAAYLVYRNTRRPSRSTPATESPFPEASGFPAASSAETINERLQQLADSEPDE